MSEPFETVRRIEFRDTDAAGIAHFSVFFTLMEQAEHEMFRSLGLSVMQQDGATRISWPRVSTSCDYKSSVRFEDEVTIRITIRQIGDKSVRYEHEFLLGDRTIATGQMITVCCRIDDGHRLSSIVIPEEIRQRLATHAAE